ncbi:uncharacterized protein FIBRA_09162 [Fibroporia radiculosa]|uniref:Uncharacterized protein n=1 Tax=Fibroporia radiculosa TaxID=599839 RepID=J4ICR2_9APHY|nr:uncharacterized protein FIBRA_09162 [Fibroporia radiculosa]CCM06856.1 predicted protein [Fibroporia radiculosa]
MSDVLAFEAELTLKVVRFGSTVLSKNATGSESPRLATYKIRIEPSVRASAPSPIIDEVTGDALVDIAHEVDALDADKTGQNGVDSSMFKRVSAKGMFLLQELESCPSRVAFGCNGDIHPDGGTVKSDVAPQTADAGQFEGGDRLEKAGVA